MKKLLVLIAFAVFSIAHAETTQVCVDVKDKAGVPVKDKTGKVRQNCRTMKKHTKLEGTRVPEKK
jgi:hypothetical protein